MATDSDRVFSPLVRIGHWGGALAFLVAYVTAGRPLSLHTRVGYAVAAYVIWRLVWGLIGPGRARFVDLFSSPRAYLADLRGILNARPLRYQGLGPIGSVLAVAMLASITAAALTGVVTLAQRHGMGPLAPILGTVPEPQPEAITKFSEDGGMTIIPRTDRPSLDANPDHLDTRPGHWIKSVHGSLSALALWLIIIHIAHVLYASVFRGENLLYDMVTGKRAPREVPVAPEPYPAYAVAGQTADPRAAAADAAVPPPVGADLPADTSAQAGELVPFAEQARPAQQARSDSDGDIDDKADDDPNDTDEEKALKRQMRRAARKDRKKAARG